MNRTVKKQWVEALRSGQYQQGMDALRNRYDRFCCLGVLTDLYCKHTETEWVCHADGYELDGSSVVLPECVITWAELNDPNPFLGRGSAIGLNDEGMPFTKIADLIEKHL